MSEPDARELRVLLFGDEPGLLSSRTWLLARIDCACSTVSGLSDFRQHVLEGGFRLIILCQTLTFAEGTSASAFAAEHLQGVPLLVMFSREIKFEPKQEYVLLDALSGPDNFMQTAKRMLAQAPLRAGTTA